LDHACFEGSDVLVQLNDLIPEEFNLLKLKFVISFAYFLFLDQLKLLLVNDVLCQLLRCLVIFFAVKLRGDLLKLILFCLNFFCFGLDLILLLLEVIDVLENGVIQVVTHAVLELLICFILVDIHNLPFDLLLLLGA
jgi:hypothetical protein